MRAGGRVAGKVALDVAGRGLRVNAVCPGVIDTPLTDSFLDLAGDAAALRREYEQVAPETLVPWS